MIDQQTDEQGREEDGGSVQPDQGEVSVGESSIGQVPPGSGQTKYTKNIPNVNGCVLVEKNDKTQQALSPP